MTLPDCHTCFRIAAHLLACLGLSVWALPVRETHGAVTEVHIESRTPYADGQAFGIAGTYETLRGKVRFAVDPRTAANSTIVDLALAPRNAAGLVEFSADVEILAPTDLSKARGTLLYDVNNRGNKVCLGQFHSGERQFLLEHGFIVVWSGWIAEVLPGDGRLRCDLPVAQDERGPLRGLVRAECYTDEATDRVNIAYGSANGSYPPTAEGLDQATLTWRLRQDDPRVVIPREQWRLETTDVEADGARGQLPRVELVVPAGLKPGYLYEVIYEAEGSLIQGLGLAGIRDLIAHFKHARGPENPLCLEETPVVRHAIGFGVSQSGRCLRQFVYDGFNADEAGAQVFDGLWPHVAGGGLGFFNHRFASPTRHNTQHDNHLFPVDIFPFAYEDQTDPYTGATDGILRRAVAAGVAPRVFHTQTSAEYWTRSGSLVHTDPLGTRDASVPDNVRIYAFGGAQHGPGSGVPDSPGNGQQATNPTDYRPLMRGLLMALEAWVREDKTPPQSIYPRLADGMLGPWDDAHSGWRPLPGVRYPEVIQEPEWRDYGSQFSTERIITLHPPALRGTYVVRVPQYDRFDNERGMLKLPCIAEPLATYTGWNLRSAAIGAEQELLSLAGSCIPFSRTGEERRQRGDPRPAIEELYTSEEFYLRRFQGTLDLLIADRYLMEDDRELLLEQAQAQWQAFTRQ